MVRLSALYLLFVVLLQGTANPAIAQFGPVNGSQGAAQFSAQSGQQGSQTGSGSGLDVICSEMMAGTFCTAGGSSAGGYGSSSAGTGASNPSLPPCELGTPDNELCN
jgi:hypothetical protein